MHPLIGRDVWGKHAMFHVYNGSIRLEEYAPEKARGKQTGVYVLMWNAAHGEIPEPVDELLTQLTKDIKSKPFQALMSVLKAGVASLKGKASVSENENQQRAIDAPNPVQHLNIAKEFKNSKGVKIEVDPRDKKVNLADTLDTMNEPRAMTQGVQAFQKAVESISQWKDLDYHEILNLWGKLAIKYHDWLAMD